MVDQFSGAASAAEEFIKRTDQLISEVSHPAEGLEEIKRGILRLGGISVNNLTGEGFALIGNAGVTLAEVGSGLSAWAKVDVRDVEFEFTAQLTPDQMSGLLEVLRCGGCGRPYAELPPGHTWREGEECRDA